MAGAGGVDASFNVSLNGSVYAATTLPSGKVWIGGAFTAVGGVSRFGLARLYPDGSLDFTATNPISQGTVYSILKQSDGKLLVGGSFSVSTSSRPTYNNMVRLNIDGSVDATFTNNNPSSAVYAIAQQSDGKVMIGGGFTYLGFTTNSRYYVARLNTDGTLDSTFNAGVITGSAVNAVAVQPDGKVLVGGTFSQFSTYGVSRLNMARLLVDGTPDLSYLGAQGSGASTTVQSIYLQNDGKSVWAGSFSALNSFKNQTKIGRLNTDGTLDGTFAASVGANGIVYALTEDTYGNIYPGGQLISYNGITRNGVARVYSDGTLDRSYNNFTNVSEPLIRCLALQNDGSIIAGGTFTSFSGVARTNLVRLYGDNYPAEITLQPQARNVQVGSNLIFSVEVSNPTAVYYQWRKDGVNIPGAVFSQYSVFNAQLSDAGNYSVFVSTGYGSTTSSNALLQVGLLPVITQQPVSMVVTQRQDAIFTGTATGVSLNYYWSYNGKTIAGATNSSLNLTNIQSSSAGTYVLAVSNFIGTVFSSNATLTVLVPISITTNPVNLTTHVGGAAMFTVSAVGSPLNYQWLKNGVPVSGANSASYSLSNLMVADSGGYSVVVSNQIGSVTSTIASLLVGNPPVIVQQPVNLTNNLGDTASFVASVSGDQPISYLWSLNGIPLTNQSGSNLVFTNIALKDIGYYSLSAVNIFGAAVSTNTVLAVNGYPFQISYGIVAYYPFNGDANDLSGNGFNGLVNGANLSSDRFGNGAKAYRFTSPQNIQFTNIPLTRSVDWTICAWMTSDSISQSGIAVGLGHDDGTVAGADGMEIGITADAGFTNGSAYFGYINGNPVANSQYITATNQWHQVALVNDAGVSRLYVDSTEVGSTSGTAALAPTSFTIGSATGMRYFAGKVDEVRIYNRPLSSSDMQMLYAFEIGQPNILQQPQSISVIAGDTANFSVLAQNPVPLSYQWYYSNSIITGATNSVLSLPQVQLTNTGGYSVVVSTPYGSIISSRASLTVGLPPQTLQASFTNKSMTIRMAGTPGFDYVLQTTTSIQPPVVWQNLATNTTGGTGIWIYHDTNVNSIPAKYYRISSH
jgi:uncharacterized delta-60 repeat protein